MNITRSSVTTSPSVWIGRALSSLAVLFLLLDGIGKLFGPPPVVEATLALGYRLESIVPLGIMVLIGTLLYLIPRTAILGAVLLTGFLGGAVASHFRIGNPLFLFTLFPVYIGALLWAGLWLRSPKLRSML